MDLIAGEFGLGKFAGEDDGAAGGINFNGVAEALRGGDEEEAAEHFDDVEVGMVIVVEQDHIEERFEGEVVALIDIVEGFHRIGHLDFMVMQRGREMKHL